MPTYEGLAEFWRDFERLPPAQQAAFQAARKKFVADLKAGGKFRAGLRVKGVRAAQPGIYEMTWAPDGRATFEYGPEKKSGEPHIIWRRIGGHEIFENP